MPHIVEVQRIIKRTKRIFSTKFFCSDCEHEIPAKSKFCNYCGVGLVGTEVKEELA